MRLNRSGLCLILALLAVAAAGCRPGGPTATPLASESPAVPATAAPASSTPQPSLEPSATPSRTPAPTATETATATASLTETAAPTLPAVLFAEVSSEVLSIYTGPGQVYGSIGSLGKGVVLVLVGVNAGLDWGLIDLGFGQTGWVLLGGLDWEGSPAQLPEIEAPPSPTPTLTPIPPPTVTELRRSGTGFYLGLAGMQPGESVSITVTQVETGTVVANLTVFANANGAIHRLLIRVAERSSDIKGEYRFFIYGEAGWTLTVTATVQ